MKVLYLIKSFAAKAGTERVMSDKMNWLAEKGYQIILVTYEQGSHPFAYPLNESIVHYDIKTPFYKLGYYCLVKKIVVYWLLKYLFRKRLLAIVNSVKPDFIVTTSYSIQLFDIISALRTCSKLILESHVACQKIRKSESIRSSLLIHYLAACYDKLMYSYVGKFDCVVSLTKQDAEEWNHFIDNVYIIPNPVTYICQSATKKNVYNRIICVGRFHEQKGFDLLIKAFSLISAECEEWHVVIFGEGEEEKVLKELISKYNLEDRIVINSPSDNIFAEYMKSDFLVLSSRYEGFGLVLLEAMSCGIPCVSFNCPYGPSEIIKDKVNGLLVENGSVRDLANKMLWMIKNERDRIEMGMAAQNSVKSYSKDVIMKKWVDLFDSM